MRRVLGIDCGSGKTGYGVIETDGRTSRVVASGVIVASARLSFTERLQKIAAGLDRVIQTYSPDAVAVEEVFYSVNVKSALKLGHVRGVALLKAAEAALPIYEYSPLQIKSSVVGYGRAEKRQVQQMVKTLLRLQDLPPTRWRWRSATRTAPQRRRNWLRRDPGARQGQRFESGPVPSKAHRHEPPIRPHQMVRRLLSVYRREGDALRVAVVFRRSGNGGSRAGSRVPVRPHRGFLEGFSGQCSPVLFGDRAGKR